MKQHNKALLILAVTTILLVFLLTDRGNLTSAVVVTVSIVTLILVIGDASKYLPDVLKVVMQEIHRIIKP